jgi:hypothetical protein
MPVDQREAFYGTSPAAHRARLQQRQERRYIAVGAVFMLGFLFLLGASAHGENVRYYLYLAATFAIGAACVGFGLVGVARQARLLAALQAQPPQDVLWYVLDAKGLHICNTLDHTPSAPALIPWTEMQSIERIPAAEPVVRLSCRGTSEASYPLDLMANCAREDRARFGDRLATRFERQGRADDPQPDPKTVAPAVELDETISDEELERLKGLIARARRPREPVFGPDGGPVAAPPPPVDPVDPPPRDEQRPHPPLPWRTVP